MISTMMSITALMLSAVTVVVLLRVFLTPKLKCPVAVNYHFTRQCNKSCGFCFHTALTSHVQPIAQAKMAMKMLKDAGMRKINFAGGEPFIAKKFLGEMVDFCKQNLQLESVSIVTNGSLVTEQFLKKHGANIDILAVSCDSFDEATNIAIGRGAGNQVLQLYRIAEWCRVFGIKFKLNTVVCQLNHAEDMSQHIEALQPFRWKCFQVLAVAGENDSAAALRDVRSFLISDATYDAFCARHRHQKALVEEPNRLMAKSYLILDEYLRFLDRDGRAPSRPILEVGVQAALDSVYWDEEAFEERGGVYDWSRDATGKLCAEGGSKLDW